MGLLLALHDPVAISLYPLSGLLDTASSVATSLNDQEPRGLLIYAWPNKPVAHEGIP